MLSFLGDGTVLTTSDDVLNLGTGEYVSYQWQAPQGLPDDATKTGFVSVTAYKTSDNKKHVIYRPTQNDKTYWNLYWDRAWSGWAEM